MGRWILREHTVKRFSIKMREGDKPRETNVEMSIEDERRVNRGEGAILARIKSLN